MAAAEQWPWSSLRWWTAAATAPPWWQANLIGRPEDWVELVNRPQSEEELAALQRCVARGRPYGTPNWIRQVAGAWGLESTLRPRGRPKK